MDQHGLLMYTALRDRNLDSPELARRIEHLAYYERELRPRHRVRTFVRRHLNRFSAFYRDRDALMQPAEEPAAWDALC